MRRQCHGKNRLKPLRHWRCKVRNPKKENHSRDYPFDFDFVVIGSGFGGSVAAYRLAEKGYSVGVMDMGRRWTPETLPRTSWSLHRWFWRPKLGLRGFFNIRYFRHVTILHGCAVGGGSITYATTLLRPPARVWQSGSWTGLASWQAEMPRHYDTASRMLGVIENTILGPADYLLKNAAEAIGVGSTFYRTSVAILQSPEGQPGGKVLADPFFAGEGPTRTTCTGCGGCMMGCRFGAKNTLDLNYLYLAEKLGTKIFPETKVVDVLPLQGSNDGSLGYEVHTVRSTSWIRQHRRRFTCRGVVFAASSVGTMDLLFDLKDKGSLPLISEQLGKHVRTNSESLLAVRIPRSPDDLSKGVAIGSGIYIDEHTHIEAVRYPAGSDTMSMLTTILTGGVPGRTRILLWLRTLIGALLRHPLRTLRILQPFGWARENVVLLCMQAVEGNLEMCWRRPWFWPFSKALATRGQKVPAYIPRANEFAETLARLNGGTAMSMVPEILFGVPGTAHCLGGCAIAASPQEGVVDHHHRVFGYRNMYICDGSVVAANLGVNPSLTITALAERAMTFIPAASQSHWDDCAQASRPEATAR